MNNGFKRQHPFGILLNWVEMLWKFGKAQVPLLAIILVKADANQRLWSLLVLLPLLLLPFIAGFLHYWFNQYKIDELTRRIILKEGVLSRSVKEIRFERVQQIVTSQTPIQKLLGVRRLKLESAGGSSNDIELKSVDEATIAQFQLILSSYLHSDASALESPESEPNFTTNDSEQTVFQIETAQLVRFGATAYYLQSVGILIAYLLGFGYEVEQLFQVRLEDTPWFDWVFNSVFAGLLFTTVLFIGAVVFNLVRTVVRFYNLRVFIRDTSLWITHGLWNNRNFILRPSRVQYLSVRQNPIQKLLGVFHLIIYQATGSETSDEGEKSGVIHLVGLNKEQVNQIVSIIDLKIEGDFERLRPNWRRLLIRGFGLLAAVAIAALIVNYKWGATAVILSIMLGVLLMILQYSSHQKMGIECYHEGFCIQKGLWERDRIWVPLHRVQSFKLRHYLWHRKLGIVAFGFSTAAGSEGLSYLKWSELKPYFSLWKARLSTENRNWM